MEKQFTDENFQSEVVEASKDKPVLVDFWAAWCGPCRLQGPIVSQVSEEMAGKAIVGKLDTEQNQKIAAQFGIMSIPTLLIFKDGKVVENFIGLQPKEVLVEVLKKYI